MGVFALCPAPVFAFASAAGRVFEDGSESVNSACPVARVPFLGRPVRERLDRGRGCVR